MISGTEAVSTCLDYERKMLIKPGDCGTDLYPVYLTKDDVKIESPGLYEIWSISTKVHLAIPKGHFAWVTGRSSSYDKLMGCTVIPGIIDHGYTGEYRIRIQVPECRENGLGDSSPHQTLLSKVKDYAWRRVALAQFIIIPFARPHYRLVEELPETKRGNDGYGSTDRVLEGEVT